MTQVTLTLTQEQEAKLKEIKRTRMDKTETELLSQVIDRGLYDLTYRTKRNKQMWQEFKAFRQTRTE
jgi:hypothetical protein